jgi:hypothetical protein
MAKFALDRRTALALNDRTRASSRPAKPAQTRASRRTSARRAHRPAGGEFLRLRVGIPETGETGIDETREPLFLRLGAAPGFRPLIYIAKPAVDGGCSGLVAPSHQFRSKSRSLINSDSDRASHAATPRRPARGLRKRRRLRAPRRSNRPGCAPPVRFASPPAAIQSGRARISRARRR